MEQTPAQPASTPPTVASLSQPLHINFNLDVPLCDGYNARPALIERAPPQERTYNRAPQAREGYPVANHKSALKRARQNETRNVRNRAGRSTLRTAIKKFRTAVDAGTSVPVAELHSVMSAVASAGSKGFITKQTASRTVGRLSKAWHKTQG